MRLEKWYLDAVFPDGTVWYGYRARLRLRGCPRIPWTSGCEVLPGSGEQKVSRWQELAAPRLEGGQWQWQGPDGFDARWAPSGPGVESVLAAEDQFQVRWSCIAPRAAVTRSNGGGRGRCAGQDSVSRGLGYLEHLSIETTRPELPFRELWWGRAHVGESSLVWIRWGGGRELTLLIEDGVQVNGQLETLPQGGVRVQTARGQWETGAGRALCDRDVRRAFPRWLVWLTRGMTPVRELKLAGSVRRRTAAGEVTGTGVWEEVKWP
ncbi:MAG TPA: hypothetical protein VNZ22_07975 [Bacillota bacterium]|nr:hypothetical protein [Bacillota bacterium]